MYFFCSTLFLFKIAIKKEYPLRYLSPPAMTSLHRRGRLAVRHLADSARRWPNYPMVARIVYAIGLPLYIVGVREHDPKGKLFEKRSDKIILAVVLALGIAGLVYSVITFGNIHI